ncbi:TIGR00730 family Rossman fold protein [Sorangium sp. So ce1153]|uniref:LOG family protein n=1 Tax=Sorangium sp. So ce1153 TaxID=3133333 RepID=UPI003F5DD56D
MSDQRREQPPTERSPNEPARGADAPGQPSGAAAERAGAGHPGMVPNPTLNRSARAGRKTEDEQLLNRPELARPAADFTHSDPWRVLRITGEFVAGFDALAHVDAAVAIFGSARTRRDDPDYAACVELSRRLGEQGFAIITGGGPGIMEAANRGAAEAQAMSIGCNIELPYEQAVNPFVQIPINFRYFFVRKTMFMKYAEAFVIFPGGFGTLDELFEALTLVQTGKVQNFPIVLYNRRFWSGMVEWIKQSMLAEGKISPDDMKLMIVTDSIDEACQTIVDCYQRRCWEPRQRAAADPMTGGPPGAVARPEHAGEHTGAAPEQ